MQPEPPVTDPAAPPDIKVVPPTDELRDQIREAAVRSMANHDRSRAPTREALESSGRALLVAADLPDAYLGFAMVALNNAFWREAFASVPFGRRLFLLPHCMRDEAKCAGAYDSMGLHCAGCGSCRIEGLKAQAEALGYRVLIAEGTTAVTNEILEEERDAVLGVACLDSLEKSFARVVDLGIPHLAVPLLSNGCVHTRAETPLIEALMREHSAARATTRTYLPLLREARRLCAPDALRELLAPLVDPGALEGGRGEPRALTDALAVEWLGEGGKRFRPFVTLAAYAVARHGTEALRPEADLADLIPPAVRRLALAIEVLHKASLVHDDIEDRSPFRYGRATLHHDHGVPVALNVGDYLVGLGYGLIAGAREALGADRIADILGHLAAAHLQLCRGQGAEMETAARRGELRPLDVLSIHALKTAPAFEAALYAGLRAADSLPCPDVLRRFATCLGEGYQVLNDLDDWRPDGSNKIETGQDAALSRPTILRAFAMEAGGSEALARAEACPSPEERVALARRAYDQTNAFDKARTLVARLRERALRVADAVEGEPLRELFGFLVRVVLDPH